ncbi:MAG: hypothetical protein ABL921_30785 [Pirellula sp.]
MKDRNQGRELILLSTQECFAIDANQIESKHIRSKSLLSYNIEQFLPLDGERMAIEICSIGSRSLNEGRQSEKSERKDGLIVIADRESLLSKVETVESDGTWVAGIAPRMFLIAQRWCEINRVRDADLFFREDEAAWSYLRIQGGKPVVWSWLDNSEETLWGRIESCGGPVHVVGSLDNAIRDRVGAMLKREAEPPRQCVPRQEPGNEGREGLGQEAGNEGGDRVGAIREDVSFHDNLAEAMVEEAGRLWKSGKWRPWIDFRIGVRTKYRNRLVYPGILAMTVAMLLVLTLATWNLFRQYSSLREQSIHDEEQIAAEFTRLFAGQELPVDVPGRLLSEARKLESTKEELVKVPAVRSSLPPLVRLLNHLPEGTVFRIDSMRLKSEQILGVEGSVQSLDGLGEIVTALRSKGYRFAEPNVNQMKDGFTLRLESLAHEPSTSSPGRDKKP